ncbi:hypothetical protein [Noviherbaspirillum pedocola]|uniref:Uncharacterized protein n=1 Tax=Noviherbaspirillum pedocola TaxID=2801341 RepID=A0A934T0I7_9BURK|nr:hypothetical protein [Noviherbaspirillum pedocola]MBK4739207.1 hypothetical protein [Noviherbaspirillum pedocola]
MKPKKKIDAGQVEDLARKGLSRREIAASLGVSERKLYQDQKINAEIAEGIERGRARGVERVTAKLWEAIEDGNLKAIMFYLRCRAGWSENAAPEEGGGDINRIEISIVRAGERPQQG